MAVDGFQYTITLLSPHQMAVSWDLEEQEMGGRAVGVKTQELEQLKARGPPGAEVRRTRPLPETGHTIHCH